MIRNDRNETPNNTGSAIISLLIMYLNKEFYLLHNPGFVKNPGL